MAIFGNFLRFAILEILYFFCKFNEFCNYTEFLTRFYEIDGNICAISANEIKVFDDDDDDGDDDDRLCY